MLRITSVMECSSGTPATALKRSGSFSFARGYWRCSGCTPTAWVGTRTNCRGREDRNKGTTRRAGVRGRFSATGSTVGRSCGPAGNTSGLAATVHCLGAASRGSAAVLPGQGSTGNARFVALISPLRDETSASAGFGPTSYCVFYFLEFPSPPVRWGTPRCHSKKSKSTCGKQRKRLILQHKVIVRKLPHYILWIPSRIAQPIWCSTVPPSPAISNNLHQPPDCGWFVDLFRDPFRMELSFGSGYS